MDELRILRQKRMNEILRKSKMSGPTEITDESFEEFISENNVALVDFWAPWCGPCKMIGPILEDIAQELSGKLAVGKMNVDENKTVPAANGIMSIPTLHIYKGGKLVDKMVGAMGKDQLLEKINPHLE